MAVVDFTDVFKNIRNPGNHSFAIVAVDRYGKTHEPVMLDAVVRAVNLSILSLPGFWVIVLVYGPFLRKVRR